MTTKQPPPPPTPYRLAKLPGGYWILGGDCGPIGPYSTKGEAEDDRRGLVRSERPGAVWSSDPVPGVDNSRWAGIFESRGAATPAAAAGE